MQSLVFINESEYLNILLNDYLEGRISRKEMEGKLFMFIKEHPRHFSISYFKYETRNDFISWLYPRLSRAIDHYSEKGSSFDAYITTMVRLSAKEYWHRKKEHRIIEITWWNAKALEMQVLEEEPEYLEEEPLSKKVSNPRQVLMLLLKSYYYFSDDHLKRLAPALGIDKDELYRMVDKLREIRLQREENIKILKERIHGQFYRCLSFEKRLQATSPDSAHWFKMKRSLEISRKRLASMRSRLSTIRLEASNEQVAKIMGLKKGTIDSNLFNLKRKIGGLFPILS